MRKILFVLCGTMILALLALSPAYARPFYQSDLLCTQMDAGFVVIQKPSGRLFVNVTTNPPILKGHEFFCQITCAPGGTVVGTFPPDNMAANNCGLSRANGSLAAYSGPLPPPGTCLHPFVRVRSLPAPDPSGLGVDCQSGYPAPPSP